MNILDMLLDPANTAELLMLCVCLAIAVVAVVGIAADAIRRGRHPTYYVHGTDRACDRAGSQAECVRRLRARGWRV